MEVAAGLEPAKTGFADQRLDHFGIATSRSTQSKNAAVLRCAFKEGGRDA